MSFQAYLDKVEKKDIFAWLKRDYGLGLGRGHARSIAHVIIHGPELRHTTGTHRDESGTLRIDGRRTRARKP